MTDRTIGSDTASGTAATDDAPAQGAAGGVFPALSAEESARRKRAFLDRLPDGEVWFFGYGSLMWNPGFDYLECAMARVSGFNRSFCVYSQRYRGTPDRPGLVLGLDRGGECVGMAYRGCASRVPDTVDYLWEREMVTGVYDPTVVRVALNCGRQPDCQAFVVNRAHPQYAGHLSEVERARMIAHAAGGRGSNREYLKNTVGHLVGLGVGDPGLERLERHVAALAPADDPDTLAAQ